jgi:hypothetical protein
MTQPDEQKAGPIGIHLSRGVRLRIPSGGLKFGLQGGEPSFEVTEIEVQLNTSTEWLDIAFEHLHEAHKSHSLLLAAYEGNQDISTPLHSEFRSAMQACVAAATFFEALYAVARNTLPAERNAPRTPGPRGSSRFAQVAEQLKRSFGLKQAGARNLRSVLSEVYRFRDEAVHPSAAFGAPVLHGDLGIAVEPRFAMYTAANAQHIVRGALAYCEILPMIAQKQGPRETEDLAKYLLASGEPLFKAWRSAYGDLRDGE